MKIVLTLSRVRLLPLKRSLIGEPAPVNRWSGILRASRTSLVTSVLACTFALGHASIIPVLILGPTPDGTNFIYSYSADLQQDASLDPKASSGVTCPSINGLVQCDPAGTFFTIYDIQGFVSASTSASGWLSMVSLSGTTPSTVIGSAFDDLTAINVTFFYTGPIVAANGTVDVFPGFDIVSSVNEVTLGSFASQGTRDIGTIAGLTDQTVGSVEIPGHGVVLVTDPTPEPATYLLLALGLLLVGLGRSFGMGYARTRRL